MSTFLSAALVTSCGPTSGEVRELRTEQKEMLARLAAIERKIDRLVAQPAPTRPDRP